MQHVDLLSSELIRKGTRSVHDVNAFQTHVKTNYPTYDTINNFQTVQTIA